MNVVELYDATAEANGVTLRRGNVRPGLDRGDKDLLASATANLLDNALKYAGAGCTVELRVCASGTGYRLDRGRGQWSRHARTER